MTALAIVGALALVLLLPLLVTAVRQGSLVTVAVRNIRRRRGEAVLVVAGALLGTAIITSSFVVGDVIEGSFADSARTGLGPVDVTLTPSAGTDVDRVAAAIDAADVGGLDGVLTATDGTVTLEASGRDAAVPEVRVLEVDLGDAQRLGADPAITGLDGLGDLGPGGLVLNDRTAADLTVAAGDPVRLHAYGAAVDLVVDAVVPEVGLAGYGGALVAPGTLAGLATDTTTAAAPPRGRVLVSLDGGVFDTRGGSDRAVADLQTAVAGIGGVAVDAEKAGVLDAAARDGAGLTQMFASIGAFSVMAGILLLINLFVMLAEERKTELGMLRAIGYTRRRLTRAFAIEGAIYAVTAAVTGAMVGVGIGWLVAGIAGPIFGTPGQSSGYPLVVEPASLALGAAIGLTISLLTVWATSLRIARLNIIRAIRDLPEPPVTRSRSRTLVIGAVGILLGGATAVLGLVAGSAVPLVLGVPLAAFAATPLLRRLLPERVARAMVAGAVLAWGLGVHPAFPEVMAAADMTVFVVQGVVLTTGAVSLASTLDRVWTAVIERLGRGGRGLAPRLGLAYPLARRFRTSMLLGMFSLVIFTVTILTTMSAAVERNTDATVEQVAAGFDVLLETNPANPVPPERIAAHPDVTRVAGLVTGVGSFEADHLDSARAWPITGFDADLFEVAVPTLLTRDPAYASDADAYRAVLADPTLTIVPENFLIAGVDVAVLGVGDTVTVQAAGGGTRSLTIAGLGQADWSGNGALVSRDVTAAVLGAGDVVSRAYLEVAPGADPEAVARSLDATFLANGADATSFTELGTAGIAVLLGFMAMLQGFLGLGLLVGIAGLGVVMVRAVRERRQEIGMLRAMGFGPGLVRGALLSEAGLIAVQGTVIGAALGLVTTRQILTSSDAFGGQLPFGVPWVGLLVTLALPLVASLAATAWPASRAAAIRPAVALRTVT